MKRQDLFFTAGVILFFLPFFVSETIFSLFEKWSTEHALIMGFIKFAILATLGEVLALRIRSGKYHEKGFGVLPRAFVWGFLGMWIVAAMKVFGAGAPRLLDYIFGTDACVSQAMVSKFSMYKLLGAFSISLLMNTAFAPVFMTLHKVSDTHILATGGRLIGFFKPINIGNILSGINWQVQWNFVFKKTIPFFWIPAHTITFLLPVQYQVLFAAILGVVLGLIMSVSANKK